MAEDRATRRYYLFMASLKGSLMKKLKSYECEFNMNKKRQIKRFAILRGVGMVHIFYSDS